MDGVDITTVAVIVNGATYTSASSYFYYSGTPNDYSVIINPPVDFPYGAVVNVQIDAADSVGNEMPTVSYSFTCLEDTQPPYIGFLSPSPGETDVPVNTDISFHIYDNGEGVNISTVSVNVNGSDYTFNDTEYFSYSGNSHDYYIILDLPDFNMGEEVNVEINAADLGGLAMQPFVYHFTCIEDNDPPFTAEWQPFPGDTDVSVDTNISFNIYDDISGVDLSSIVVFVDSVQYTEPLISFSYQEIENGYHITINPVTNFDYGDTITVSIDAQDYNSPPNEMDTFTYSFVCQNDVEPPYIANYDPIPGSENNPVNTNVSFYVFDDIFGVDINSLVVDINGTEYSILIGNLTAEMIGSENEYHIEINPTSDFGYGETVNVQIDVADLAEPANWLNNFSYSFQCVEDVDTPYLGQIFPSPNSFNVPLDTDISFHIYDNDYGVDINTVIVIVQGSISPLVEYSLANGNLYYSGNVNDFYIEINPDSNFAYGEIVNVQIDASDLSSPPFEMGTYSFAFQCVGYDENPPFLWEPHPFDGETGVAVDSQISFYVLDNETGVDENSIVFSINGIQISNFESEAVDIYQGPGFKISYSPTVPFDYGESVTIGIIANDLASDANTMNEIYTFQCVENSPPIIELPDDFSFLEDSTLTVNFAPYVSDINDDNLTLSVTGNVHVNVSILGLEVTFGAEPNWNGSESLTFFVNDNNGNISSDVTDIIVLPVNDNPEINLPDNFTFAEDANLTVDFSTYLNDIDNDNLLLNYTGNVHVNVSIEGTMVTFGAESDWNGTETLTFYVNDENGRAIDSDEVEIIVTPVNDAPTINLPENLTFYEDDSYEADFSLYVSDIDDNNDDLSISCINSNHINVSISGSNVIFTAEENWSGSELLTFVVTDTDNSSASDQMEIIVLPVNDAPTINLPDNFTFAEDESLTVDFTPYVDDIDNNENELALTVSGNAHVTVAIEGMQVVLNAEENWYGDEILTFFVNDETGRLIASDQVDIIVTPVNDAPSINLPDNFSFNEDDSLIVDFSPYLSDIDDDNLMLSVSGMTNLLVSINNNLVTFRAATDWNGTELLTFTVEDIEGATDSDEIEIVVFPTNDSPEIVLPDNFTFNEDGSLIVDFQPYITDIDGDDLVLQVLESAYVNVAIDETMVTFTAEPDWNGTEILTFFVNDSAGRLISSDQVEVIVIPENDDPIINLPNNVTVNEDENLIVDFSDYVNDIDGDELSLSASGNENIMVSINGLEVDFEPESNWNGTEIITFTVSDNQGKATASDEIEVIVLPVNDSPEIDLPDNFTFAEDESLTVDFQIYTDDIDGDDLVLSVSGNSQISVTINDLEVTFTAEPDWNGNETLTFFVSDNNRAVAYDDVSVNVVPVNDPPTVELPDSVYFDEDKSIVVNFSAFIADDGNDLTLAFTGNEHIFTEVEGNIVTFTAEPDWNGSEELELSVSDGELVTTASLKVVVKPVNDPPVIDLDLLPLSIEFKENSTYELDFGEFVSDPEENIQELSLSASGNEKIKVEIDGLVVHFSAATEHWAGTEIITFTVSDNHSREETSVNISVRIIPAESADNIVVEPHTISAANPQAEIFIYTQESKDNIECKILNRRGKIIKELSIVGEDIIKKAIWNATDKNSVKVSGGFYIYRISVNGKIYQGSILVAR